MSKQGRILVVDDEANVRRVLCAMLRRAGYAVDDARDGKHALEVLSTVVPDAIITDLRMPRLDGMGLLRRVQAGLSDVPVIIITAHGSVGNAVEAIKMGAFDYITKPFEQDDIREVVTKAVKARQLAARDARPAGTGPGMHHGMIGESASMWTVYEVIEKVAASPTTVLITGESGTGKELVAKAIHASGDRSDQPFIKINCAAIPRDLMESELFGYEKGAFTGAVSSKQGRFELAQGGTLFLDEIGEIPVEMQVKLLRVLQEGEFERIGGLKTFSVDVRLIAATNRDLQRQIEAGRFREDLYYRLNVVRVEMPALRERTEDIPLLISHFLEKLNSKLGKEITTVEPSVEARLRSYSWPGNIREFENVLERAVLFSEEDTLRSKDLPEELREAERAPPATPIPFPSPFLEEATSADTGGTGMKQIVRAATERIQRDLIVRALEETGGNVTRAARKLGISRKSLQMKMKEFGLREPDGTT